MSPSTLPVGASAEAEHRVEPQHTATQIALAPEDEFPPVFATARMVALMEVAAARALRPLLGAGELSVGVEIQVRHTAATPIGATVRAVAIYTGIEGKLHRFRVEAFDDAGSIGSGEHTRAIVASARLLAGAERRAAPD
jgi:fluoroacetyl-CoA thioesterase